MIKKYIAILLCISMFLLTGCGTEIETYEKPKDNSSMFVRVEGDDYSSLWWVVYHRDTKVMYEVSLGGNNRGNFTLLVNPDGTPMLWED